MWKKPGEMWTGGGGLYYVSFTCYLSGIVMTNRDNQSLQQLFRFRIRWVGSNFFGSKRESSTNIHTIRDDFNVQTCKLCRPVTWNVMARRFWHSGWRQIQKSPSFNRKQWIVSGTCCYRAQILVYMSRSRVPNHPIHIHTCWNLLKFLKLLSSDYRQKKNKKLKTNMTFSHFCFRKFLNHFLKGVSLVSNGSWIIAFKKILKPVVQQWKLHFIPMFERWVG